MASGNVLKIIVTTVSGLCEFLRMPFELCNDSRTFQEFRNLPLAYSYIDDSFVGSSTVEEHMEHLPTAFDRLQQFGVVLKPSKCLLVASMRDFPPPSSKRQPRRFPDTMNFYRWPHPNRADTMLPLISLLSSPRSSFEMSADAIAAFDKVEAALVDATLLIHSAPGVSITIMEHVPNFAFDAVLQQHLTGQTSP
nr:unnamed protein product [Spirometra erinaceieuropaei]